jgi:hypothetical protein
MVIFNPIQQPLCHDKNPDFKGVLSIRGLEGGKTCHARQDEFALTPAP